VGYYDCACKKYFEQFIKIHDQSNIEYEVFQVVGSGILNELQRFAGELRLK
jgi:hypothetical protein